MRPRPRAARSTWRRGVRRGARVNGDGTEAVWGTMTPSAVATVGSSDGHGHSEILWQDAATGALTLWTASASGGAPVATSWGSLAGTGWRIVGSGDLNHDGI